MSNQISGTQPEQALSTTLFGPLPEFDQFEEKLELSERIALALCAPSFHWR
jgi:hypothetical protein